MLYCQIQTALKGKEPQLVRRNTEIWIYFYIRHRTVTGHRKIALPILGIQGKAAAAVGKPSCIMLIFHDVTEPVPVDIRLGYNSPF